MTALNMTQVWPGVQENPQPSKGGVVYPWTKLEDICNYKTSSGIAHQYRRPPSFFYERPSPPPARDLGETDMSLRQATYRTTYGHDFQLKFNDEDVMRKADRPAFRKFSFMQTPSEQLKFTKRKNFIRTTSEYVDKYMAYPGEDVSGSVEDFTSKVHCPVVGVTKGYRPMVPLDVESAAKYIDPYVSTAHMDYNFKTHERLAKLNSPVYFANSMYPQPMTALQRSQADAILYRDRPKRLEPMMSITHEHFKRRMLPADPRASCTVLRMRQTQGDVIRTPAMYHTEYDHIGSSWHTDILVDHL